jgi:hypothetical protein
MCSTFVGILIAALFSVGVFVFGLIKSGDLFIKKYD